MRIDAFNPFLASRCSRWRDDSESSEADSDSPSAQSFDADDLASSIATTGRVRTSMLDPKLNYRWSGRWGIDLSQFQGEICENDWCPCTSRKVTEPDDLFICDPSSGNDPGYICGWKRGEVMGGAMVAIPNPIRACGSPAHFEGSSPRGACGYRDGEPGCFLTPRSNNSNLNQTIIDAPNNTITYCRSSMVECEDDDNRYTLWSCNQNPYFYRSYDLPDMRVLPPIRLDCSIYNGRSFIELEEVGTGEMCECRPTSDMCMEQSDSCLNEDRRAECRATLDELNTVQCPKPYDCEDLRSEIVFPGNLSPECMRDYTDCMIDLCESSMADPDNLTTQAASRCASIITRCL